MIPKALLNILFDWNDVELTWGGKNKSYEDPTLVNILLISFSPALDDPDFDARPMVMLVGQYSTGKTTFIRYLLEQDFPGIRIGPEPTTDRWVIKWSTTLFKECSFFKYVHSSPESDDLKLHIAHLALEWHLNVHKIQCVIPTFLFSHAWVNNEKSTHYSCLYFLCPLS